MPSSRHLLFLALSIGAFPLTTWAAQVRGTVLDVDGKPLSKITVHIADRTDYLTDPVTTDLQTDDKGTFNYETPDGRGEEDGGGITASIVAPGLATQSKILKIGDNEIRLRVGRSWGGVVLDDDQKPVAGVTLRLMRWSGNLEFDYFSDETALQAVTDAEGRYHLDNVPTTGVAAFSIRDPRFVSDTFAVDLAPTEAPPIFVKPGATVTGRLVTADGAPLSGIRLYTPLGLEIMGKTAPDGTFSMSGLKPGQAQFYALKGKEGWVIKSLRLEGLKAGETRNLPDWVALKGVEITGLVVDATTKKPLQGVNVQLYSESSDMTKSDATGHFKLTSLDANYGQVSGPGYIAVALNQLSIPKEAKTYDLGTLSLERGVGIQGEGHNEKGEKLATFGFTLKGPDQEDHPVYGRDGQFKVGALPPGTYTLTADDFEVVSPKTLVLKLGQTLDAVEVVLRFKKATRQLPLRVHVVNGAGEPIAGAQVAFKTSDYGTSTAISGLDGSFQLEASYLSDKPAFDSVERPGFVFSSGGEVTQTDTEWQTTVVLSPAGQIFKGIVVDAADKPMAGAWVAVLGDKKRALVQTDAAGAFAFKDLPASEISLAAAQGASYGTSKTRGDAKDAVLKLAPPVPTDANAVAETILNGLPAVRTPFSNQFRDILGYDRLEKIALRADGALDGQGQPTLGQGGWNLAAVFTDLETRNPQRLLERGPKLLPVFKDATYKGTAAAALARTQAKFGDADQQALAKAWLDREKAIHREIGTETVTQYLALASVAKNLKLPEAGSWVDFALTIAAQLSDKTKYQGASNWGGAAVGIDMATFDQLLEELNPPQVMGALGGAVRSLARSGDIENAKLLLTKMQSLQSDPQVIAGAKDEGWLKDQYFNPASLISAAQVELTRALATRDAPAAWKLAGEINDDFKTGTLLTVGNAARLSGHPEIAAPAMRAAFDAKYPDPNTMAKAASIANLMDTQLGAELFDKARERALAPSDSFGNESTIAPWAFYHAPFDMGLSRVLLEREWSWRLPALQAEKKDAGYSQNGEVVGQLAWAMSVLDPKRAAEWAESVPDQYNSRSRVKTRIAAALLATPDQRATFEVGGN